MNDDTRAAVFKALDQVTLADDPIRPDWVLAGQPRARSGRHSINTDGWATTHVWECSAGCFRWHFGVEETVLVLDGEVRVTDAQGRTELLRAGSVGYFPSGTWWVWEVPQHVRKLSFNRRSVVRPARWLSRLLGALPAWWRRRAPPAVMMQSSPALDALQPQHANRRSP